MAHRDSNGHMADDPRKVKVMTPIYLDPIISTTAGDTDLVPMKHIIYSCPKTNSLGGNSWQRLSHLRHAPKEEGKLVGYFVNACCIHFEWKSYKEL